MIFFMSNLGEQLLKSMQADQSHWKYNKHTNELVNKQLKIELNFHNDKSSIYRLNIDENEYTRSLTFLDIYFLCREFRKSFKYPKFKAIIPNSINNPEEFI